MHSVSVTPIYQPCEQSVSVFCFFSFFGLFGFFLVGGGGGGEGVERRGKGGSMSFDLRYFFPKVLFYIIPYVRAFLLIQCFFS